MNLYFKRSEKKKFTLEHKNGKKMEIILKDSVDGKQHSFLIIDGKEVDVSSMIPSENKNDCFYKTALVAKEIANGRRFI
jgi:hypothetical protein